MVSQNPFAKVLLKKSQKSSQETDYSQLPLLSRHTDIMVRHESKVGMKILNQLTQEIKEDQKNKILGFFSKFTEKLIKSMDESIFSKVLLKLHKEGSKEQ